MSRLKPLDILFLISVLSGPATSYSVVYLFHIALALKLAQSATAAALGQGPRIPAALYWDTLFFACYLGWYVFSIGWVDNVGYALRYCSYIVMATLTVFYVVEICNSRERLAAAVKLIFGVTAVQVALAILEALRVIRLPFSPYSPYLVYFGRLPSDIELLSQSAADYILSMPTGFMGNPNNISAFLVLFLPMFLFVRSPASRVIGAIAVLYIVFMAGARSALLGFAIVLFAAAVMYTSRRLRLLTLGGVVAAGVLLFLLGDLMRGSSFLRVAEVADIASGIGEMITGFISGSTAAEESAGVRVQLILNGLDALGRSRGLGVGAGGHMSVQEHAGAVSTSGVTSMHNFWIEVLVDGGVAFGLLFYVWYFTVFGRLWQMGRHSGDALLQYLGKALSVGFVGFLIAAVGPSSVIYMLPMWLMIGLALAALRVDALRVEEPQRSIQVPSGVPA